MPHSTRVPKVLFYLKNTSSIAPCNLDLLLEGLVSLEIELYHSALLKEKIEEVLGKDGIIKRAKTGEDTNDLIPDMIIFIPEEGEINEINSYLEKGAVPIIEENLHKELGLSSFDAIAEKGECFCFSNKYHWDIFKAVVSAWETYKYPYDWKNIVNSVKITVGNK